MLRAVVLSCLIMSCPVFSPCVASDSIKNKDGTPPEGAPWTKDFLAAHQLAMQSGRPMFLYFTKTYCPHCVKFERDVLTKPELRALYGQVIWVHVFRDFSDSVADRAAERVEMRFGVSSYPQHILVDPSSLTQIASTGRTLDSFAQAVVTASRRVRPSRNVNLATALKQGEEKAQTLETEPTVELAEQGLRDPDIAVQLRALEYLKEEAPESLIAAAPAILRSSNDLARYRILEVLEAHPDPQLAPVLLTIVKRPTNSRNPNVLRIFAVRALGACGGKESLSIIAGFASSGDYLNGLTRTSVQALTRIAQRETAVRADVAAVLIRSFPAIKGTTQSDQRYAALLAETIHNSLEAIVEKKVAFPTTYNQATRVSLMTDWTTVGRQAFNTQPNR